MESYAYQNPGFLGGLPAIEVEIIEQEVRRLRRRIAPPEHLRFIDAEGQCMPVAMYFVCQSGSGYRRAEIRDIGVGGFGLTSALRFKENDEALLVAKHTETGRILFEEAVRILNVRGIGSERPATDALYTYGTMSLAREHSDLYKCILDSVFLDYFSASSGDAPSELPWNPHDQSN